jgi:hypothetical protein
LSAYKERKITDVRTLKNCIRALDIDEGIRINGTYKTFGNVFIFVTKTGAEYTLEIVQRLKDEMSRKFVPGQKREFLTFRDYEEVWKFLENYKQTPLEAWYY